MRPLTNVFRTDPSNVGDWFCSPHRYFPEFGDETADILKFSGDPIENDIIVGGGGLVAVTFHKQMDKLAAAKRPDQRYIAWGIGESEYVDRSGAFVPPFAGPYPDYIGKFDLVGVRDYGTSHQWVPCVSCLLDDFDQPSAPDHDIVIYEHKRIPIPIDENFPRRNNDGRDLPAVLNFLRSGELIITNSYHGAYWATLLGKRVLAVANMSKMYRMKHAPAICRAEEWRRFAPLAPAWPGALHECRKANIAFHERVRNLLA